MKNFIIAFMIGAISFGSFGCTSSSEGGGVTLVEGLSSGQFQIMTNIVNLGTKFGVGRLISSEKIDTEGRDVLRTVASTLREVAVSPASESVTTVLTNAVASAIDEKYARRDIILKAVKFAEDYVISKGGGFSVIRASDGGWALSYRSQALVLAVADGIEKALRENPGGLMNLRVVPQSTEVVMEEAFRRAEVEANR